MHAAHHSLTPSLPHTSSETHTVGHNTAQHIYISVLSVPPSRPALPTSTYLTAPSHLDLTCILTLLQSLYCSQDNKSEQRHISESMTWWCNLPSASHRHSLTPYHRLSLLFGPNVQTVISMRGQQCSSERTGRGQHSLSPPWNLEPRLESRCDENDGWVTSRGYES
jgi:hypothetical protein